MGQMRKKQQIIHSFILKFQILDWKLKQLWQLSNYNKNYTNPT